MLFRGFYSEKHALGRAAGMTLALALVLCLLLLSAPAQAAAFPDVVPGSWYEAAVEDMTALGLFTGCDDGSFQPQREITAAEFVTVAARSAGLSPVQGQCGHWAAGTVSAALNAGWLDWDELPPTGERFDAPITRKLAVKVLMKALLPHASGSYSDWAGQIADFPALDGRYYDAVFAAYAAGVVTGDGLGRFRPEDGLSRAEACALFQRSIGRGALQTPTPSPAPLETQPPQSPSEVPPVPAVRGPASENGWLQVVGTQLCNEAGEPIVLHGMSSHGLQWYDRFACQGSIASTAEYGANVFRVAMYTGEGGYLSDPQGIMEKAMAAADAAIACDMYVILDWHILSDGDPMTAVTQAESFFTQAARRYRDTPNVIYEICNEPNGSISWSGNVKPYAQRVVAAIRAQSPRSVILIGSPTWSQDVHLASADPVEGENLMYTLHFYAGTHGQALRDRADQALAQGLPLFVSEWGTSRADGSGGVFPEESAQWLDFLDRRGISWCGWSLCDKNETSAALCPGSSPEGPWDWEALSQSGQFMFGRF